MLMVARKADSPSLASTGIASQRADGLKQAVIIAREDEVVFNIMTRMARRGASIAVVVKGRGRPYVSHVTGIISRITSPIPSPKVSDLTQDNGAATEPMGSDRREVLTVTIGSLVFDAN